MPTSITTLHASFKDTVRERYAACIYALIWVKIDGPADRKEQSNIWTRDIWDIGLLSHSSIFPMNALNFETNDFGIVLLLDESEQTTGGKRREYSVAELVMECSYTPV
jgi:hypothetical protein